VEVTRYGEVKGDVQLVLDGVHIVAAAQRVLAGQEFRRLIEHHKRLMEGRSISRATGSLNVSG
jgi:hypothetical protein